MSGRIRTFKPEILEDAVTAGLTDAAYRLFTSVILLADDYGNFRAEVEYLRGQVYWKAKPSSALVDAVTELSPLVRFYEVNGQRYGHVKNWEKHQKVSHRGRPRIPSPPDPPETFRRVSGDPPEPLAKSSETLLPDRLTSDQHTSDHHGDAEGVAEIREAKSEIRLKQAEPKPEGLTPITSSTTGYAMAEEYAAAAAGALGGFALEPRGAGETMKRAINAFAPSGLTDAELRARIRFSASNFIAGVADPKFAGGYQPAAWAKWLNAKNGWTLSKPPPTKSESASREHPQGLRPFVRTITPTEYAESGRRLLAALEAGESASTGEGGERHAV